MIAALLALGAFTALIVGIAVTWSPRWPAHRPQPPIEIGPRLDEHRRSRLLLSTLDRT